MGSEMTYTKKALKSFRKIDKDQQKIIVSWIERNLITIDNRRVINQVLIDGLKEYLKYLIGSYCLIAVIDDKQIKINVINVGYRKDIYS